MRHQVDQIQTFRKGKWIHYEILIRVVFTLCILRISHQNQNIKHT